MTPGEGSSCITTGTGTPRAVSRQYLCTSSVPGSCRFFAPPHWDAAEAPNTMARRVPWKILNVPLASLKSRCNGVHLPEAWFDPQYSPTATACDSRWSETARRQEKHRSHRYVHVRSSRDQTPENDTAELRDSIAEVRGCHFMIMSFVASQSTRLSPPALLVARLKGTRHVSNAAKPICSPSEEVRDGDLADDFSHSRKTVSTVGTLILFTKPTLVGAERPTRP